MPRIARFGVLLALLVVWQLLALAAGIARSFDRMLSPLVFLTYPVPKIVMLPVFMLWFGIGDLSKILIIALACFYPAFINAYYGARATPRILVWSARNMGAREAEIFRRVVLPGALPLIFAGLRARAYCAGKRATPEAPASLHSHRHRGCGVGGRGAQRPVEPDRLPIARE